MSPYFILAMNGRWLVSSPHSPPLIGCLTSPRLIHHPAAKLIMPQNICHVGAQTRRRGFEQINPQIRASCKIEYLSWNLISFFAQLLSHLSPSQYSIPTPHTSHPAQCSDSVTRLNDSYTPTPIKILAPIIQVNNSNYDDATLHYYCQAQGQTWNVKSKLGPEIGFVMGWPTHPPPPDNFFWTENC